MTKPGTSASDSIRTRKPRCRFRPGVPGVFEDGTMRHWRWLIRRDMEEVLEIERLCFQWPWKEDDFILQLRKRNCIGCVIEEVDSVIGFCVYELYQLRIDIIDFAVLPRVQRTGVGRLMLEKLKGKLSRNKRRRLSVLVRETNIDALLFFRASGFRCHGIQRDAYEETDEDGYRMEYEVSKESKEKCSSSI